MESPFVTRIQMPFAGASNCLIVDIRTLAESLTEEQATSLQKHIRKAKRFRLLNKQEKLLAQKGDYVAMVIAYIKRVMGATHVNRFCHTWDDLVRNEAYTMEKIEQALFLSNVPHPKHYPYLWNPAKKTKVPAKVKAC